MPAHHSRGFPKAEMVLYPSWVSPAKYQMGRISNGHSYQGEAKLWVASSVEWYRNMVTW